VLASLTGENRFADRAGRLLDTFAGQALSYPLAHVTLLNGFERLARPLEAVIVGDAEGEAAQALARALAGFSLPDLTLSFIDRGDGLPESHPAHGKDRAGAAAALYLCRERTCSLPLTDPGQLTAELVGARADARTPSDSP